MRRRPIFGRGRFANRPYNGLIFAPSRSQTKALAAFVSAASVGADIFGSGGCAALEADALCGFGGVVRGAEVVGGAVGRRGRGVAGLEAVSAGRGFTNAEVAGIARG